jgi:Raf kinase inhibitor-like YbhB/YbcL family protein
MAGFTLSSNQFTGQVPEECLFDGLGVGGRNKSPFLSWSGVPEGTQSFILFLHDPDAPAVSGFTHWCAFNIPGDTRQLSVGASTLGMPEGSVQARNSFGNHQYDGPAPPPGDGPHAYNFTLYALDTKLELDASAPPPKVVFMGMNNVLGKAGLTAYYGR